MVLQAPLALSLTFLGCGGTETPTGPALNGCTDALYIDRSAPSASRTVAFGGFQGSPALGYSPPCISIAVGQTVTFAGGPSGFGTHPLNRGTGPTQRDTGTAGNPIPRVDDGNRTDVAVAFPAPGLFPYHCEFHFGGGMYGVVRVR
jgi:plastocyanin